MLPPSPGIWLLNAGQVWTHVKRLKVLEARSSCIDNRSLDNKSRMSISRDQLKMPYSTRASTLVVAFRLLGLSGCQYASEHAAAAEEATTEPCWGLIH